MRTYADIIAELPETATPFDSTKHVATPRQLTARIDRILYQLNEEDLAIVYKVARNLRNEREIEGNESKGIPGTDTQTR